MAGKRAPAKVLVVEGENDAHIFWNLLDQYGYSKEVRLKNNFTIEAVGGFSEMQKRLGTVTESPTSREVALSLSIRIKNGDIEKLGLVADADQRSEDRWASLRSILEKQGVSGFPSDLPNTGAILEMSNETPSCVGVWIMPNNFDGGMIEDWAQSLRPLDEPQTRLWERARKVIADIPLEDRLFHEVHLAKAIIHTWLAWQEQPGKPIGQAIKAGYLKAEAEPAKNFMTWFQQVFALDLNA